MRRKRDIWFHITLASIAFFALVRPTFSQAAGLDGYWLQLDDRDGRPRSIIQVRTEGALVTGWVAEVFLPPGLKALRCGHCEGSRAGKPILGMQVLSVERSEGQEWDGKVFDPLSGKEYKCLLKLDADGKRLYLRGYIGVPAIGRTQVWRRFGML